MKKISKFLLLSAFFAGIFGATLQKNKEVLKTEAVNITQGTKLYLEPNAYWLQASARFAAYFYGDGDTWIDMTQTVSNPLYYEVTMDQAKSFTNVVFVRMNPDTTDNNWNTKWNQTDDLVYDGTNNLFTVAANTWDKGGGTWSTYVEEALPPLPEFTPTVEGINSSKVRIWLDRSGEYDMGYTITMKVGETYYEPTGYEAAIHEGRWFAYYDMPLSAFTGSPQVDLVVFITDVKEEKVISTGAYIAGDNNKVWKINKSGEEYSIAKGAITDRIIPEFFAKVLEGYLTCSTSAENGYNAYPDIDTYLLPRDGDGHWNMEGNLDGNMITDYSGVGSGNYGSDRGTGVQVDAYDKYAALQSMYNNGKIEGSGAIAENSSRSVTTSAVLIVGLLGITTLAGFYFLQKKKYS